METVASAASKINKAYFKTFGFVFVSRVIRTHNLNFFFF